MRRYKLLGTIRHESVTQQGIYGLLTVHGEIQRAHAQYNYKGDNSENA